MNYATMWMNPEDILLNEMIHTKKTKTVQFHLHEVTECIQKLRKFLKVIARFGGEGDGKLLFHR